MKKLTTGILGGMPLTQDDLAFIQAAYTEAFTALTSMYTETGGSNNVVIISGIEDLGSDTYGEGWVIINGEVCYFPQQTNASGSFKWITLEENDDPNGLKDFETTGANNVYKLRTAKLNAGGAYPPGYKVISQLPTVWSTILKSLNSGEWLDLPGSTTIKYYISAEGFCHLNGIFTVSPGTLSDQLVGTLPAGNRPPEDVRYIYVSRTDLNNAEFYVIEVIASTGTITVKDVPSGVHVFRMDRMNVFRVE